MRSFIQNIRIPRANGGFVLRLSAAIAAGFLLCRCEAQPVVATATIPAQSDIKSADAPSSAPVYVSEELSQSRMELAALVSTNGEAATKVVSVWLDRLLSGQLAPGLQLEVLEAAQKHAAPEIKAKLAQYNDARLQQGGMATSSELLYGGDAANGRKLFFEHPATLCFKCHKVANEGGETGPPLNGVGSKLKREELLESILFPDAKIAPGYETVLVRLKDRSGRAGVLKCETDTELTLDCPPDGLITIKKSDIALRRVGASVMPDEFGEALSKRQLRDLVEFLSELK